MSTGSPDPKAPSSSDFRRFFWKIHGRNEGGAVPDIIHSYSASDSKWLACIHNAKDVERQRDHRLL